MDGGRCSPWKLKRKEKVSGSGQPSRSPSPDPPCGLDVDDTRIPRRNPSLVTWFDAEGWIPAWDAVDTACSCEPEVLGGVKRYVEPIQILTIAEESARSRHARFPRIRQDLGEAEAMIIGPLRQSYMEVSPGTLISNLRFPGSRMEDKELAVVGGELQYRWELMPRKIESFDEIKD